MFDSLEKIITSDTFYTIVSIVVVTLVSLAAAQSALLDLSHNPDEVPLLNKIIGYLGLGAAMVAVFYSSVMRRLSLILMVLGVVALSKLARRYKTGAPPSPASVPDEAISSFEPNPKVAWCGRCKAHTKNGEVTVRNTDEHGHTYKTYKKAVCSHCGGTMLWNVPSDIRKTTHWSCSCSSVLGLIIIACLIAHGHYKSNIWYIPALLTGGLLIPVLAFLTWVAYLRIQWLRWLKKQP
ncbi:MAG: hypothetical protein CMP14_06150 [Rickettsiales bacterium]|nr:hypothetical protein [Rickettsiales bacterium]|tara:strand:- start:409 stop:1119 length:711 start_codon:yes stop_codon:yes gene_type:complete